MEILKIIIAIIAILAGLTAIIKLVVNIELVIGLISLTFGILAIIWTLRARSQLSQGSSLKKYTTNFLLCLIFILMFSIWHTLIKVFGWKNSLVYPEYIFITLAYLIFVLAAYQILYLGKEFGFQEQAKKITKAMKTKKD